MIQQSLFVDLLPCFVRMMLSLAVGFLLLAAPPSTWVASQFWTKSGNHGWNSALWGSSTAGRFGQTWVSRIDALFSPPSGQTGSLASRTTIAKKITVQNGDVSNITFVISVESEATSHLQVGTPNVPTSGPILGLVALNSLTSLSSPGRLVIAEGEVHIANTNSPSQLLSTQSIEILEGAVLSSDADGRSLVGSTQVRDQDMIFAVGSAANGFLVQSRGLGSVIDPSGAFAIIAIDATDGLTILINALYDRLILHTLIPPAVKGGVRFDLRGGALPGATPIPLMSWIESAETPLDAFSFIHGEGQEFDPTFGTGGVRIVQRDGISTLQIQLTGDPQPSHNWSDSTEFAPGIRHVQLNVTSPRRLSINALRIDLTHPGIRFMTTPRTPRYVENEIETSKQRTKDFLAASRSTDRKLIVAINASPWTPWPAPSPDPGTANITGLAISDGVQVSPGTAAPVFWIGKDRRSAGISKKPSPDLVANMLHAMPGFQVALIHDAPQGADDKVNGIEPRTGYGVSDDGRYVILMTVDGRQSAFSQDCTVREVGEWLKYFGAADGINMDGGGSTTMVRWTGRSAQLLNRPSEGFPPFFILERPTGNNLGVYHLETRE